MNRKTDYPRIYSNVFTQAWDILPGHHAALSSALLQHVSGAPSPPVESFSGRDKKSRFLTPVEISADQKIAVVHIQGTLAKKIGWLETACGGLDLAHLDRDIEELRNDGRLETVILNIDSPGGMARASSDTAARVLELSDEKRTVAYTDGQMCSAGYKLGVACSEIYAARSAEVGCVGTYIALYDQSKALKKAGIELKLFRDGKYKALGHPGKEMSAEESEYLEAEVAALSARFKEFVKTNRPNIDEAALQGQTLSGRAALKSGLIDGFFRDLSELVAAEISRPLTY